MKTLLFLTLFAFFKVIVTAVSFEYWANDDDEKTFDDAQLSCQAWGGYLAIVNEQNYMKIHQLIENTMITRSGSGNHKYWIGAKFLIMTPIIDYSSI